MEKRVLRFCIPIMISCLLFSASMISADHGKEDSDRGGGRGRNFCSNVRRVIRNVVLNALRQDPSIGAALIRLHFHDCFVRGCDGSILLDPTPSNPQPEKIVNVGLRGFEVIDAVKQSVEAVCPGVISCADILAIVAHDVAVILGKMDYDVTMGRLDGTVSYSSEVFPNLPAPFFDLNGLKNSFASKGLSTEDLVVLSGAHSVGRSHCSSFSNRLSPNVDPALAPAFASSLSSQCSAGGDQLVFQDFVTPYKLDAQYYKNIIALKGVLASDSALLSSDETSQMVNDFATTPRLWECKFGAAMIKLGSIGLLTGNQGEIRKSCRVVNQY